MTFVTSCNTPKCGRLKSSIQKATDEYDRKVLRRVRGNLNGPVGRVKRERATVVPPMAPLHMTEEEGVTEEQWVTKRVRLPSKLPEKVPTVEKRGEFSEKPFKPPRTYCNPEIFGTDTASASSTKNTTLEYRHETEWLKESRQMAKQAEGHTTYTHDLRKKADGMNRRTNVRAKQSRLGTNQQLRNKVRDVQKVKAKVEEAVNEAESEFRSLGQVKQFIIEIKAMLESGSVTGCDMRIGLRESRPPAELTRDHVDAILETEFQHHSKATDTITKIINKADAHMETLRHCVDTLYNDLEDKVEGLRIDEQCLVLDGSSSVNIHMGGTSADQPPLEIMLDNKAREVIQGLEAIAPEIPKITKQDTDRAVRASQAAVITSLALRKEFKKTLIGLDTEGRKLNKKVEAALRTKMKLQENLLRTLESRISCLNEERLHLESQMGAVRQALSVKNKEKDIVCKRLRLRRQIPNKDLHDKVHDALENEYDLLSEAVQAYTNKLSHITLEISRMHDTLKSLQEAYSMKRTALSLDQKCFELPFICNQPWPQQLYNGICSGLTAVYGAV